MEIFRAEEIVKQFSNHLALDKVSLEVQQGSIFGLLGPNGAGKTTMLRIINQITAPDSGNLFFKNRKLTSDDIINIGYLPEERGLYKKMKVGEQAVYLAQLKGLSKYEAMRRLKYWFDKFEIQAWWNKKVDELSKGMQQKVQFIITIVHEPELLIFDEPFTGFDPINTDLLKTEIISLKKKGVTVIFSTHNMASVEELCDHITLIDKAKNILSGAVDDIKQQFKPDLFQIVFKGDLDILKTNLYNNVEIVKTEIKTSGISSIVLKTNRNFENNDLLSMIIPFVHIISYEELLPSMNDIFIKVVKGQK
jgi:ABC-2 type transport system ATP-binding protein